MFKTYFILLFLSAFSHQSHLNVFYGEHDRSFYYHVFYFDQPKQRIQTIPSYEVKWFETKLDHFNFVRNDNFKIRYLINTDSRNINESNPPILFYTGNEGNIELFWNNTGLPFEFAKSLAAIVVFAEHRYYGHSSPCADSADISNSTCFGYLSAQQALADFAMLIVHLRRSLVRTSDSPVIAFGGSYGGMLAAWIRIKYPHLVQGAIASSAPVLQFTGVTPCERFDRRTSATYQYYSVKCADVIRKSWSYLEQMFRNEKGRKWLSDSWHLCQPLTSQAQLPAIKDWLKNVMTNLAMINYPYPANFLTDLPANPVKVVCDLLTQTDSSDNTSTLTNLYSLINLYFNHTGSTRCIDYSSDATSALDDSLWNYQSCTEMVMPMCSNGVDDMYYTDAWNLTDYAATCRHNYKTEIRPDHIVDMFGAHNLRASSNIVFTNGEFDPWISGGVTDSISETITAYVLPKSGHHYDLRPAHPLDTKAVIELRSLEMQHVKHWIHLYQRRQNYKSYDT